MSVAVGSLQAASGEAVAALREIFNDESQPGNSRVSAAAKLLTFAIRTYYDLGEIDDLLQKLRDEVDEIDNAA